MWLDRFFFFAQSNLYQKKTQLGQKYTFPLCSPWKKEEIDSGYYVGNPFLNYERQECVANKYSHL